MAVRPLAVLAVASALALAGCLGASAPPAGAPSIVERDPLPAGLTVLNGTGLLPALPAGFNGTLPSALQFLLGERGGEPNVGVTSKGTVFITADDHVMRSEDGGATWKSVYEFGSVHPPQVPGVPVSTQDPIGNNDPYLWVDPITDRIFAPLMFPILTCSEHIWSDDDGKTWLEKPMGCGLPLVDHQRMATGPPSAKGPQPIKAVYPNVVYYCYFKLVSTNCAVSYDGGLTYPIDQPIATRQDACSAQNGTPAVAKDGTVYVPMARFCPVPQVAVSEDNGQTWEIRKAPATAGTWGGNIDPDVTVTPDGTLYLMYEGDTTLPTLLRSKDKGKTWEGPWTMSPPEVKGAVFTVITSGDDGRLAFGYLGTASDVRDPSEAPADTRWHAYLGWSLDANATDPTFVNLRVTPDEDPVQIGCVWLKGGGNPCRNLLDFIDLHVGPEGRAYMAITDGCTKDCAGNPSATNENSRRRDTAVIVQQAGPSLFASVGMLAPLHANLSASAPGQVVFGTPAHDPVLDGTPDATPPARLPRERR
ncbi:MAG TPA: sialidase family protein [Candidatus Thermoplasmatota archaeon]|nr:sialidase family protein [Candidatus Thermoplasmatota archaeon]